MYTYADFKNSTIVDLIKHTGNLGIIDKPLSRDIRPFHLLLHPPPQHNYYIQPSKSVSFGDLIISSLSLCSSEMQYTPFASDIELPFYTSLASHKINHDKLDDAARPVLGLYEIRPSDPEAASCRIQIHGNALTSSE